jgi:LEA14-like dessication related protein
MLPVAPPEMAARRHRLLFLALVTLPWLAACVSIPSDFKEPGVTLISIRPQLRNLFAPQFDVVLQVTNPNRVALEIVGLGYTIHLQGIKLIEGVATDIPKIAAYGKADVSLKATADLAAGLGLLGDLLRKRSDQVDFELNADIDLGSFYPMVRVQRRGSIVLQ